MAITPKEAEEKYVERIYRAFKRCEKYIDKRLVDEFGEIREKEEIYFHITHLFVDVTNERLIKQVSTILKDKYSGWAFEYIESDGAFKFKYKLKEQSLLDMLYGMEERLKKLDIRDETEDEDYGLADKGDPDIDEIPF